MSGRAAAPPVDGEDAHAGAGSGPDADRPGPLRRLGLWLLARYVRLPVAVRLLAPLGVMTVLWMSSARPPGSQAPSVVRAFLHNGAHVVAYFGLGGAWLLALLGRRPSRLPARPDRPAWPSRAVFCAALALTVTYGVVDELHQRFVPGRHSSVYDVISDAFGAVLAVLFVRWLVRGGRDAVLAFLLALLGGLAGVCAATFL